MRRRSLFLASLLGTSLGFSAVAQEAFLDGEIKGQGFVFAAREQCWLVTPAHVVSDREASSQAPIPVKVGEQIVNASPPLSGHWIDKTLDLATLQLSACLVASREPILTLPSPDVVMFRKSGGSLDFVKVEEKEQGNGYLILHATSGDCPFKTTLSGSLAMLGNKRSGWSCE